MGRIRSIKPEFFADESLASCSAHARLLAIALLQLCDSQGVFRNIPMQVHAHAFPWETEVNVPELLGELEAVGYVNLYTVAGKRYGYVPGFSRHQRLTGKEAQSGGSFPGLDQADQGVGDGEAPQEQQGTKECFPEKQRDAQEQGTGNREQGEETLSGTARRILDYLNEQACRNYQPVAVNLEMIGARLKEGATEEQCRAVIERMVAKWKGDAEREQYLRPATLFNRTKFAQYVGELGAPLPGNVSNLGHRRRSGFSDIDHEAEARQAGFKTEVE